MVAGAGVAGLAAAAMLASRFAQVTVIDRDELAEGAVPRRGVPQSEHGHVLLGAGQQALEKLLPGLREEMIAAGAVPFEPGEDLAFHRYGARWPKIDTGLELITFSRPLLEWVLRGRVAAFPNVAFRSGLAVSGLSGDDGRVTGVTTGEGGLDADLVVDCTGRGSRSDRWLAALGLPAPRVTEVRIDVGYSTRLFRRLPGDMDDSVAHFALPTPPHELRAGLALPIEGDRWLISMGGWHGDYPGDEDAFLAHAKSLPLPEIARLVTEREPLTDLVTCGYPASRRRHFEELDRVPAGYLALGDAMCSFNPIYGQGMTCGAQEAVALGALLDAGPLDEAAYYREAARIITTPWQFAVGADFTYPQTKGERPRGVGLRNRFGRELQFAAQNDPEIRRVYMRVQHLLLPPEVLFKPAMIVKILRAARRRRKELSRAGTPVDAVSRAG
ncbi:FAD-binding monooxygenase [Actinorhabdospora filicis]|uniref:FAD-binding monooxygenase n=1 Tax=Actinorhabdospora filicis TaxID=1785913 RepID=A0A9W6SM06_9ACTN|nr:FAD-binding monooxygenase [Actinorhabdospora filicis]